MLGGIKLIPTSAYGVRLYQNGSSLMMHYDKVLSHDYCFSGDDDYRWCWVTFTLFYHHHHHHLRYKNYDNLDTYIYSPIHT